MTLMLQFRDELRVGVKRVAGRTDGPDEVRSIAGIQRLAQPADVHVHGARVDVGIVRPDRIEQSLTREDPAGMLEEMLQEPELGRAERDLLAAAVDPV